MNQLSRDPEVLFAQAEQGNRIALARLLSMVERGGELAQVIASMAYRSQPPYSLGLTGAPGAGKSTLTDQLISAVRRGWPESSGGAAIDDVAVVAVDPSSPFTGGAILGDRVRMQDHATDPSVFIRSMATRGHLGGLTLAVPGALRLFGAAGLPVVLIETVGVGQMEVEVAGAADTTVVVVNPGWGDSMQANKAGLLEIADIFVINKADRPGVREARRDLEQMLDLSQLGEWRPPILETVAADGTGVQELWETVAVHRDYLVSSGELLERRAMRLREELRRVVAAKLALEVEGISGGDAFDAAVGKLVGLSIDPYTAADQLLADR